jgi:host factor-I protein
MEDRNQRAEKTHNNNYNNSPTGQKEKAMEKLPQNIQEAFLNTARKERTFLTIYLMSGVKLSGRIKSFDKYSVVLESNNQEQLIFKHAISTVVISRPSHGSAGLHSSSALGVGSHGTGLSTTDTEA